MNRSRAADLKKGFTLIELLIVVAIIAILAAIAVPNFLEAQTRAKISRIKADQRSLATAIEAYSIDANRPQPGTFEIKLGQGVTDFVLKARAWITLTTPVSYIASIPVDPFYIERIPDQDPSSTPEAFTPEALWANKLYAYECLNYKQWKKPPTAPSGARSTMYYDAAMANGFTWYMTSGGPLGNLGTTDYSLYPLMALRYPGTGKLSGGVLAWLPLDGGPDRVSAWIYDPTNGTVSPGMIIRTNQGILTQRGAFHVQGKTWIP